MSEAQTKTDKKTIKLPQRKPRQKRTELEEFKLWVSGLESVITPNVHLNGRDHSTAILTVDFGSPLDESNKLSPEQNADLITKMKTLTKSLYKSEVNVRVQNDQSNGVWWTSIN